MGKNERSKEQQTDRYALMVLTALGTASAAWAVFLWRQLVAAREGADPVCVFGSDCAQLWDGAFAATVHRTTGLPVAGWGTVWGLAAALLPLLALASVTLGVLRAPRAAIRYTAFTGLAAVALLLGASLRAGAFCGNCAVTYALTIAYAALALSSLQKDDRPWSERGAFTAATLTLVLYATLLLPGSRTPRSSGATARAAVATAAERLRAGAPSSEATPGSNASAATAADDLVTFLASLPEPVLEGLATSLARYRDAPARPVDPPRAPLGAPAAPVVITEFVDTLCSHCADLHETMGYLLETASGRFTLDSRHYPLDGNCNPRLPVRGPETVRCLAARVQVCAEGLPGRFQLGGELFAAQEHLTVDQILGIATRHIDAITLDACLADPATERKLQDDVAFAGRFDPTGTPLVLVNGRQGTPYPPFLLAMILARGDADHPAFGTLPPAAP